MEKITFYGSYISQKHIEQCIDIINGINNDSISQKINLIIDVNDKIVEIDILFIGYLLLLKKQNAYLEITINFNSNLEQDPIIYKIRQYLAHSFLTSGVIPFKFTCVDSTSSSKMHREYSNSWIVWSESFLPILFIDSSNFKNLFIKKSTFIHIADSAKYSQNHDDLYQACRSALIIKTNNCIENNITILGQLAFYKALSEAKIISLFLYSELNNGEEINDEIRKELNIQAGRLQSETYNYYSSIKEVFEILQSKPAIFQFIFSALVSSELLGNDLKNDTINQFTNSIKNLFDFTNELVAGIKELGDNIIKHSETGIGVITGRVFNPEMLSELKIKSVNNPDVFKNYIKFCTQENNNEPTYFFDINIIDNGKQGVINSLIKKITIEDDDYQNLKNNNICFKNFIDPKENIALNHQAKRATAHIGLLIFSKLIESNNGLIRAGTWDLGNNRDNVFVSPLSESEKIDPNSISLCKMGTNYNIVFPIIPTKSLHPLMPISKIESPVESNPIQVKSIESLLGYNPIEITDKKDIEINSEKLYIIKPFINEIYSYEDEKKIWFDITKKTKFLLDEIKTTNKQHTNFFICLNLDKIEINGSQLFRLLGKWELDYSGHSLIVYNITTEIFHELSSINHNYFLKQSLELPYWNLRSLILFYSFFNTKNGRFYFSDIFWGGSLDDFINSNLIVKKSSANSTTIINKIKPSTSINKEDSKLLIDFGILYNGSSLLPFDLILKGEDKLSIFEHNSLVLLQNELKLSI